MRHSGALFLAAALAAAVVVPAGAADCPPGDPACPPQPPGSIQVNPDPIGGELAYGQVAAPGVLIPLEAVVPMPLQGVAVASLNDGSAATFDSLSVPLRYQDPSDVSCGVQALGMALDGLGAGAPESSALLGFLQGNSMMYEFGTGVEELAYAAQSFGYKGSYAFHGATLSDLAAQLAAGSPVVVSIGANGEGQPGHFVTVTGISSDGAWVSYNDPTLGEVVVSAEEFERLWGLQGNSGVAVAKAPPASAPDLYPWVALSAAVMALVSTTPLGTLRRGVGGRIVEGTTSTSTKKASTPKPASKPAPKPKPKPKPAASSGAAKAEAEFVANPPPPPEQDEARFVTNPPASTPKPATPAASTTSSRFDDEEPPDPPAPIDWATLLQQDYDAGEVWEAEQEAAKAYAILRAIETAIPASLVSSPGSATVTPTPQRTPTPTPTPIVTPTPEPPANRGVGGTGDYSPIPALPAGLRTYFPTLTAVEKNQRTPYASIGILELGMQEAYHAGVPSDSDIRITPTKIAFSLFDTSIRVGWLGDTIEVGVQTPRQKYGVEEAGATMSVAQSATVVGKWDGWNSTTRVTYNPLDFVVSAGDDPGVAYGYGSYGVYAEEKFVQTVAAVAVAKIAIGVAMVFPEVIALLGLSGSLNGAPAIP